MILPSLPFTINCSGLDRCDLSDPLLKALHAEQPTANFQHPPWEVRLGVAPLTGPADSTGTVITLSANEYALEVDLHRRTVNAMLFALSHSPDYVLCQCLNALLCLLAIEEGGCGLHAACVYHNHDAVAISGRSGVGKTTLAQRLCPPARILDDDFCLLLVRNGTPLITCSPFEKQGGWSAQKGRILQLRRIIFPRKALGTGYSALSPAAAYRHVSRNCYGLPSAPGVSDRLMDNLAGLCHAVPMVTAAVDHDKAPQWHEFLQEES